MNNLELADKLQATAAQHYGDLCGMLWDGGAALRKLHTENTALRVTEENLLAELENVRKNAERYRWLKTHQLLAKIQILPTTSGPSLDAAIDAAMKGKE